MRFAVCLFIALVLGCICSGDELKTLSDALLAREYRSLRAVPGHFSGAGWNQAVDAWNGRKHLIMVELGDRLTGRQRLDLSQWLGVADLIAAEGDLWHQRLSARLIPADRAAVFWVYYWRGPRDFLFFALAGESIIQSGWWHAYE